MFHRLRTAVFGCALALLFPRGAAFGLESLQADLRYTDASTMTDTLEGTLLTDLRVWPWLDAEFGARFAASSAVAEALEYKGELIAKPFDFLAVHARLEDIYRFNETVSATTLLFYVELTTRPFCFLGGFFDGGWYERYTQLSGVVILPTPFRGDFRDHDFAALFGIDIYPIDEWRLRIEGGNFEELSIYSLDNPYFGLELRYQPHDVTWEALAYARYQVLLGFGRLDQLVFGVGMKWRLGS